MYASRGLEIIVGKEKHEKDSWVLSDRTTKTAKVSLCVRVQDKV